MALTITGRGSHNSATNLTTGATMSTTSFTPSADSLLLLFIATQGGPGVASDGVASVSNHGTWTRMDAGGAAGNDQLLELWACITGSSPGANDIDVVNTTQTKIRRAMSCIEVAGIDETAALSSIIYDIDEVNQGTAGLSGNTSHPAIGYSGDATVGAVCGARYQEDTVWDSPMVEVHDLATGTELMRLSSAGYVGEDTSPSWSWSANNRTWRAISVQINDPAGDGVIIVPARTLLGVGK